MLEQRSVDRLRKGAVEHQTSTSVGEARHKEEKNPKHSIFKDNSFPSATLPLVPATDFQWPTCFRLYAAELQLRNTSGCTDELENKVFPERELQL